VALQADMRRAGRGAPPTPDRLKHRRCPTLSEHRERFMQSQYRDVQILRKRRFEKRDESPACAERILDAPAAVLSFLVEFCPGFA
jgi:hypothetical protein